MRIISLLLLSLSLFCYSLESKAQDYFYTDLGTGKTGGSPSAACQAALSYLYGSQTVYTYSVLSLTTNDLGINFQCEAQRVRNSNGATERGIFRSIRRSGDSCPLGHTFNGTTGICEPPYNPCESLADQPTNWKATYPSSAAYNENPIRCTTSQNGCAVEVCNSAAYECGTKGSSGEFACWGSGTYTGDPEDVSEGAGTEVSDCEPNCEPPPPQTTDSSNSCTTPTVSNGVTSYSCYSESNADQFANSNCAVGGVNGVTALHCTSPDYVPESDSSIKESDVEETTNPDGGSTTVVGTTTTDTHCKAGDCTTSTTGETTTTTKDPNGNTTGESSECSGDKCDNPTTPEDESEEEEKEEGVEREVTGEDCSSGLACAGDAIDCAVLRQLKEQRCSMDWNTNKSAVLAEAGKSEYQLGTDEIDAADLFSGPSAGRWLSPTCPADRVIHLATTGTSITFSWSYVCQYADALGNLLVALASLFFAVYVGRAFGGD